MKLVGSGPLVPCVLQAWSPSGLAARSPYSRLQLWYVRLLRYYLVTHFNFCRKLQMESLTPPPIPISPRAIGGPYPPTNRPKWPNSSDACHICGCAPPRGLCLRCRLCHHSLCPLPVFQCVGVSSGGSDRPAWAPPFLPLLFSLQSTVEAAEAWCQPAAS